ncbi:apotyrosinase chaperone MelC1 [Streptomyces sp. URMC 124]|uniref:apotyrosinase chaperone MelC1 n=1 Tax=Streptomyces sp. URMC 124 TaxID=3423405 RepID=UPI003F1936ED
MSSNVSRRVVLRGTAAAAAGVALLATGAQAADHAGHTTTEDHTGHGGHGTGLAAFDEVYKGRRIVGKPVTEGHHAAHGGFAVTIDGRDLHIMRNGDGTWISVINHYEVFAEPLSLTRAAVDKLRGAQLVPIAM